MKRCLLGVVAAFMLALVPPPATAQVMTAIVESCGVLPAGLAGGTLLIDRSTGALCANSYGSPVSGVIATAMTGTTSTALVAAPAAGLRNYITHIVCSNAHATVGTDIIVQDGSGGTTIYLLPAAAVYGGASMTLPTPLRQPTTATALFVANVTTGASTKCAASGYKGS